MCLSSLIINLSGVKGVEYHKYAKELVQNWSSRILDGDPYQVINKAQGFR